MTPTVMAIRKTASTRSRVSQPSLLFSRFTIRCSAASSRRASCGAAQAYVARRLGAECGELREHDVHGFVCGLDAAVSIFAFSFDDGFEFARADDPPQGVVDDIGAQREADAA